MKLKKTIYIVIVFMLLSLPLLVFAEGTQTARTNLPQPLGGKDISGIAANIIETLLGLVGVLALIMFIYGGIMWMTSAGSKERIEKGRKTIVWAVLGLAIVFFSYAILDFILGKLIQ